MTFVQTADIALSDYNFRYDKSLKRIAVYDGDALKCTVASDGTAYQPDNSDRSASYAALGMSEDFLWLHGHDFHGVYREIIIGYRGLCLEDRVRFSEMREVQWSIWFWKDAQKLRQLIVHCLRKSYRARL